MTQNPTNSRLRVENISCVLPESQKSGGLFVGNIYGAKNAAVLKQYGIRAVLTCSQEVPCYDPMSIPFHFKINALDQSQYRILDDFSACEEFIDEHKPLTNVYVHCYAGVSRSVTIVVAYLMKKMKWDLDFALDFVKAKRIVAQPNEGFMIQLRKYDQDLKVETSRLKYPQNPYALQLKRPIAHEYKPSQRNHNQSISTNSHTSSIIISQCQPNEQLQTKIDAQLPKKTSIPKRQLSWQSNSHITTAKNSQNILHRHRETPIPSILSKNSVQEQYKSGTKGLKNMRYDNQHRIFNNDTAHKLESAKSTSRLIRPIDLPGYKYH